MTVHIISRNKQLFNRYNEFRKKLFTETTPRDSEAILYLLPWLLSVNVPECPGYIPDIKLPFRVYNIEQIKKIKEKEPAFKRLFKIRNRDSLLSTTAKCCHIQGLYTIGSVGTISQTPYSDCDIWVCYDKKEFDQVMWDQLNQKINLIKDWMDMNYKVPVYFFICDINDVKNSVFGSVDTESSGSAQRNVLKEEFYRTTILICGKIPFWWVAWDRDVKIDYDTAFRKICESIYGGYDYVDLGNLERVDRDEYFGAALWQLHKSLTRPLKSIIKMALLKLQLDAPDEKLLCHQLREQVLAGGDDNFKVDPVITTMLTIFDYYQDKIDSESLKFLMVSFYLRCELKAFDRKQGEERRRLAAEFLKLFPLSRNEKAHLSNYSNWSLSEQIRLGNRLFKQLFMIYKQIRASHKGISGTVDNVDLTVLGRKIAACYQNKDHKVTVFSKPSDDLNIQYLTLCLGNGAWRFYPGSDNTKSVVKSADIIYDIAFIVWNDLFDASKLRMEPNASRVTLQEVINLARKMKDFFGSCQVFSTDQSNYLKKAAVIKILVIISFEKNPYEKDINDFGVVYQNSWGELFVRRFNSPHKLNAFMRKLKTDKREIETSYYLQRNCTYYEKIIERTKRIGSFAFGSGSR